MITQTAEEVELAVEQMEICRRCKSTRWTVDTVTSCVIDVRTRQTGKTSHVRRAYRCANCGIKATVPQVPRLEANFMA